MPHGSANRTHFELYAGEDSAGSPGGQFGGSWRWRLRAANGRIVADSGEAYKTRAEARRGITLVKRTNQHTPVEVFEPDAGTE